MKYWIVASELDLGAGTHKAVQQRPFSWALGGSEAGRKTKLATVASSRAENRRKTND